LPTTPLKILITAYDFFPNRGGVATYAQEVSLALAERGHYIQLLIRDKERSSDRTNGINPMGKNFNSVTKAPKENSSSATNPFFLHENVTIHRITLPNLGYLAVLPFSKKIRELVNLNPPDFILSTLWLPGALSSLLGIHRHPNPPPVFTAIHGMEILQPQKGIKAFLRRRLLYFQKLTFSKVSGFFCVSSFSRDLVLKHFSVPEARAHVVPNGVNFKSWNRKAQKKITHTSKTNLQFDSIEIESSKTSPPCILLTVSRLVPHKGIDNMIRSLPEVLRSHPDTIYQIGGKGPDEKRLKDLVSELNLEPHVQFLGFISDDELPELYKKADLFVLMSRQEEHHVEGFGLVFLEAACLKTPSLGGRSGGIPDAIVEGQTGWLSDPESPSRIAQTLIKILNNPDEIIRRGQKAFLRAQEQMTWKSTARLMDDLWKNFNQRNLK